MTNMVGLIPELKYNKRPEKQQGNMESRQPQFAAFWHWPYTRRGRKRIEICVGIWFLSGFVAYAVAYLSVMHVVEIGAGNARGTTWSAIPRYRRPEFFPQTLWPRYVTDFFMPANQIDRYIRADLWKSRWEKVTFDGESFAGLKSELREEIQKSRNGLD